MRHIAAFALAAACLLPACSRSPDPGPAFDQVYTTRGVIRELPNPARPSSDLLIWHEPIPEFVNGAGDATGMDSMTMPFPHLAEGVSLDGLDVDDKVRFTFGVTWAPAPSGSTRPLPTWTITQIEELPAETELELGSPVIQPASEQPDGGN